MAKKRRVDLRTTPHESGAKVTMAQVMREKVVVRTRISPPTGDIRHVTSIREGKISFEEFSKERLATIPVDYDVGRGEETENAAEQVQQGREESQAQDAAPVRESLEEGVLRPRKQTRTRKKSSQSSQQHVREGKRKTAPKAPCTKASVADRLKKLKGGNK